jgi:hypothetical protein
LEIARLSTKPTPKTRLSEGYMVAGPLF